MITFIPAMTPPMRSRHSFSSGSSKSYTRRDSAYDTSQQKEGEAMFVSCHVAQVEVPGPKGSKEIHRNQPINLNFIATFRYNEEEYPLAIVFSRPGASQVWMFDKEADAKNAYLNLLALTTTITARGPHTDEGFGE